MAPAPRILVIDPTPIGSHSATGQFKQMLFEGWPASSILELTTDGATGETVLRVGRGKLQRSRDVPEVAGIVRSFAPQVIYVRPELEEFRHLDYALYVLNAVTAPAMMHIMDDWVAGDMLPAESRSLVSAVAGYVAKRASVRYTDGPAYIADFERRLGVPFENLLNGVDLDLWRNTPDNRDANGSHPFTLTHMGNYEATMSRQAVIDIAQAVEALRGEFDIRFDVHLRGYVAETARLELARYPTTRVLQQQSDFGSYVAALRRSDVNVYAYNQDPRSVQYMGKGIPNKTCELMAAGKPILAYGPKAFAGLNYLGTHDAAQVVSNKDDLVKAIRELHGSQLLAARLVANADKLVRDQHDATQIRARFLETAKSLAAAGDPEIMPSFSDLEHNWWGALRPVVLRQRLLLSRPRRMRAAINALPRLALHSALYVRTTPVACALVAILAASLTVAQAEQWRVAAGGLMGGFAWGAVRAGVRLVEVFVDRVLSHEGFKHKAIRRISGGYASVWTSLFVMAAGGVAGRYLWNDSWLSVAGASVLAAGAALLVIAAAAYPGALNASRRAAAA